MMDNNSFTRGCSSGGWIEQSTTNSFVFGLVSDRNGVTPIDGDRAAAWNRGFFKHQRRQNKPEHKGGGIGIHGGDSIVVQPPPSRFLSLAPFFSVVDGMVWSAKARRGGKGCSGTAPPSSYRTPFSPCPSLSRSPSLFLF
ncbi:hypothetical protein PIB30_079819 [Stylosanthes scabra]|uniref:Uncharacterized protein n=1 Tax=Stylosanthes scabra TaxID=79078 RepID=A0ABU6TTG4_9FABA|nr:hypothetical protein [Stylosanthes scabra]